MTTQEFVKKEAEQYAEGFRMTVEHSSWYHQKTEPFKSGLTKGLEIAEKFYDGKASPGEGAVIVEPVEDSLTNFNK